MIKTAQTLLLIGALVSLSAPCTAIAQAASGKDSVGRDSVPQTLAPVKISEARTRSAYGAGVTRTATRTLTPPIDVPQSITTINSALIRDQGMKSMAEIVRYVPGITMGQGEGNRDQPTIRGNSSTADFFVDGVRDDAQYFRDTYNLERVEALKGSNAMIFGRGGGGGILNRVSKEASWVTRRDVNAEAGTFGARRVTADLQQYVSPQFAARLNSVYEHSDFFRNGVSLERVGINPTISIVNAARKTHIAAGYEHFNDRRTADRGIPSFNGRPLETDPTRFFGSIDSSRARIDLDAATLTLTRDAGSVEIRNHSRFSDYRKFYQNVFPGAAASGSQVALSAYNSKIGRRNFFNQTDAILLRRTGSLTHELLVGAELGRQTTSSFRNTGYFGGDATSANVSIDNPVYVGPLIFRQAATDANSDNEVRTSSIYVQDQIAFAPQLRLIAGARYENFALRFEDHRTSVDRHRTDGMVSPRIGLVAKPAEALSVYASFSVSFLPGSGDQFSTLTDITKLLEPERFTNHEVGVKWDVFDGLNVTGAAYRLDRTNSRSTDPSDPARVIQTGAQRSQGIELTATGRVTRSWEIASGATRQSAKIINATVASPAGARVPLVPRSSMSLWNKYSVTERLGLAAGVIYQSKMFAAIDNKVTLPSFTRVDGALYAGIGLGLRAQLNVENVFNVKYFPTSNGNNNIAPGSPREARLSISATF